MTLGDGNWKMGEGVQVGKTAKLGDSDETVIIEHFARSYLSFQSLSLYSNYFHCTQTTL